MPAPAQLAAAESALTAAGVRPRRGDPRLARLVAAGVAPTYFGEVAQEALTRGGVSDPYAWAMAKVAAMLVKATIIHAPPSPTLPDAPSPELAQVAEAWEEQERRAVRLGFPSYQDYYADVWQTGGRPTRAVWKDLMDFREQGCPQTAGGK